MNTKGSPDKRSRDHQVPSRRLCRARWGRRDNLVNLPTAITSNMTSEQLDAYIIIFRISEITDALRGRQLSSSRDTRSPSPDPEYDQHGRRTNTRQQRHRKKLEQERSMLVDTALKTIPAYSPPFDHRPQSLNISEKIYLPVADYPAVNFIGQLLGPRGGSLKAMNARSGADIRIRGKGSVKEGKGHGRVSSQENREPLHCLITAESQIKVDAARKLVESVIEVATCAPDHENGHKIQQLRDLAAMNGTLRDDEANKTDSQIQGRLGTWHVGEQTASGPGGLVGPCAYENAQLDREYERLMADIEGPRTKTGLDIFRASGQKTVCLPPWRVDRLV